MRSLDIERAQHAAAFITDKNVVGAGNAWDIRVEIESLPAKIIQNGLLQTLLFLLEQNKPDRNQVGAEMIQHLKKRLGGKTDDSKKLAIELCRDHLRRATEEALRYAYWLKLMAKASIPKPRNEQQDAAE